jgi:hypothetical protein
MPLPTAMSPSPCSCAGIFSCVMRFIRLAILTLHTQMKINHTSDSEATGRRRKKKKKKVRQRVFEKSSTLRISYFRSVKNKDFVVKISKTKKNNFDRIRKNESVNCTDKSN